MKYREDIIYDYAENKDVLDIGCYEYSHIFRRLKQISKSVTGIDKEGGKGIIKANAETFIIKKKFDYIRAGNIVEHLSNPGKLLDNVKRHLKDDGVFVLETANVKGVGYIFFKNNPDHVAWYCKYTLTTLLERHGFIIKEIHYCVWQKRNWVYDRLRYLFANNIIMICKKNKGDE